MGEIPKKYRYPRLFWFLKSLKKIIPLAILCYFLVTTFSLSPQWCLSKERVWKAQELDMTLYVDENYQTKFYQFFYLSNRDELKEYVSGKLVIDGKTLDFNFDGEDHFSFIVFGNATSEDIDNEKKDKWKLSGSFRFVINPKKLRFLIMSNAGKTIPKNITELTFVPA